jgi:hypothetical protein
MQGFSIRFMIGGQDMAAIRQLTVFYARMYKEYRQPVRLTRGDRNMRSILLTLPVWLGLTSCAVWGGTGFPQLVETEAQLVGDCMMIATITETADAGNPFPIDAKVAMLKRVKSRAVQLDATHLVWLHKTYSSATAQAYRCDR